MKLIFEVKGCLSLNITVGGRWRGAPGLFYFQKCAFRKKD